MFAFVSLILYGKTIYSQQFINEPFNNDNYLNWDVINPENALYFINPNLQDVRCSVLVNNYCAYFVNATTITWKLENINTNGLSNLWLKFLMRCKDSDSGSIIVSYLYPNNGETILETVGSLGFTQNPNSQLGNDALDNDWLKISFEYIPGINVDSGYCTLDNVILYQVTGSPTISPTITTTSNPTDTTIHPTQKPTINPSETPSINPTQIPTRYPSQNPTINPTTNPSLIPTFTPSNAPVDSVSPTIIPSTSPSKNPTLSPSDIPTISPSKSPFDSLTPTIIPSIAPTIQPSNSPSTYPSLSPSYIPSNSPSKSPTSSPSNNPSKTFVDSLPPTINIATILPTKNPTYSPSFHPSNSPISIRIANTNSNQSTKLQPLLIVVIILIFVVLIMCISIIILFMKNRNKRFYINNKLLKESLMTQYRNKEQELYNMHNITSGNDLALPINDDYTDTTEGNNINKNNITGNEGEHSVLKNVDHPLGHDTPLLND